jgi:hypothetical protein
LEEVFKRPFLDEEHLAASTIPELPVWLQEIIRPHKEKPSNGPTSNKQTGKREHAYAEKALTNAANKVAASQRGGRNSELNTAAFCMGTLIARGWIGAATVEGRLYDAARACGLLADDGERAVRSTVKSGIDAGNNEPHPDLKERDRPDGPKSNRAANPMQSAQANKAVSGSLFTAHPTSLP